MSALNFQAVNFLFDLVRSETTKNLILAFRFIGESKF